MTAAVMCESPLCVDIACKQVLVEGTALVRQVCHDRACVRWAKDQLGQDRPGAVIVTVPLNEFRLAGEDEP